MYQKLNEWAGGTKYISLMEKQKARQQDYRKREIRTP